MYNEEVITERKTQAVICDCVNEPDCIVSSQSQITGIICKLKNYIKSSKLPRKNILPKQPRYI